MSEPIAVEHGSSGPDERDIPANTEPAAVTLHKIRDGDSLPLIAERYLGDAGRAEEIYQTNRDVLASPDLLPIGVELRIFTPSDE
jgi:nucleoid-associated protein YgaU